MVRHRVGIADRARRFKYIKFVLEHLKEWSETPSRNTHVRRMKHVSLTMLCDPVLYIFLTMTLSIARISEFAGKPWSLQQVYVGAAIYECSGIVNVLLYTATRKGIISWDWLFRTLRRDKPSIQSTSISESKTDFGVETVGTVDEVDVDDEK